MAFEIHMLSVGAADAMVIRYFIPSTGYEFVVLIDAGHQKDGPKIVEHIRAHTTQKYIDLAICTHPDADHIGGFSYIVKNIRIEEFWIHDPSKHKVNAKKLLRNLEESDELKKGLKYVVENLRHSNNLIKEIDDAGIERKEPFVGVNHPLIPLMVVGPTQAYYEELLGRFRDADLLWEEEQLLEKSFEGGQIIAETMSTQELLDKDDDPSRENNSSVILLFSPDNRKHLFTSDAGPKALARACEDYDLSDLEWLDVPHHGSRYNLTSNLIKHFNPKEAFISSDGSKHYPNNAVVAELKKIGSEVHATHLTTDLKKRVGISGGYGEVLSKPM